jgi:hypothetical protein
MHDFEGIVQASHDAITIYGTTSRVFSSSRALTSRPCRRLHHASAKTTLDTYGHIWPDRGESTRAASDYLAAALTLGLEVRRCEEPRRPYPLIDPDAPPDTIPADEPPDMWSLHSWCPAATNAAYRDNPAAIIWHFQLSAAAEIP